MIHIDNISSGDREISSDRRGFLKGMLGAGAFVLSIRLMPEQLLARSADADGMTKAPWRPNVYLAIDADGTAYIIAFFFSSRRRHTRLQGDWSSDVCSSD